MIRKGLLEVQNPAQRVALLDLSIEAETLILRTVGTWRPANVGELLEKNRVLAEAAAGAGLLEAWEWEELSPRLVPEARDGSLSLGAFLAATRSVLRAVEWGSATVHANYWRVVERFLAFEPLAAGFGDDRIRSSLLLPWGDVAGRLAQLAAELSGHGNVLIGVTHADQARGLNPGLAEGVLEVVTGSADAVDFRPDRIYVLSALPADLAPVAGIASVSEGNAVSHVQLLARNLGIPNAVVSPQSVAELMPYSGERVFYAVTPGGRVFLKRATAMTDLERTLVGAGSEPPERVRVPVETLDLGATELVELERLRASDSGRLCGPKAANLGQLGVLFPGSVPRGLVIPFGVFHQHLEQPMPGSRETFWTFVQATFSAEVSDGEEGVAARLEALRAALKNIPFLPGFEAELKRRFREALGADMEELGVFVRSDTNMEDLVDFTGAGLNLTVANARGEHRILQAIRDVWASPFTERSYTWRRRLLANPQAVYSSVLILPSIDVDKSGVLITTGIASSNPADTTVAFDWGGGGAVAGQAAESYLLEADGTDLLLAPAREPESSVLLPGGGIGRRFVTFHEPVLGAGERSRLREISREARSRLPDALGTAGPFDLELGFEGETLWLFQARPFVESSRGRSMAYLASLDRRRPRVLAVPLDHPLEGRW